MIATTNVGTISVIKKDLKKKSVELITRYHQLGLVEDHFYAAGESADEKFSIDAKTRALSQQSSRKKIETIRQHSGRLINATTR